ncbi:cation transporter [Candidatus Microgenomates bacterium]|nr:cation transporter [Candidatus Microgenomates bacterium]
MQDKKIYITSEKVVKVSFFVDITDVLINLLVAIISGSVIMLSQALQGSADLLASGLLIFGVKKSKGLADRKHPFGYGREVYFWTFLSALTTFRQKSLYQERRKVRRYVGHEADINKSLAEGECTERNREPRAPARGYL